MAVAGLLSECYARRDCDRASVDCASVRREGLQAATNGAPGNQGEEGRKTEGSEAREAESELEMSVDRLSDAIAIAKTAHDDGYSPPDVSWADLFAGFDQIKAKFSSLGLEVADGAVRKTEG